MWAGRLARLNFDLDRAGLTRPEDFRKVHSGAPSAWNHGFDIEISLPAVLYRDRSDERLALRLLAEVQFLVRQHQFGCVRVCCG